MAKNTRQQSSLLQLPDGYDKKNKYLDSFVRAKSLNDQIEAVKTIYLKSVENPEVFQFLSDLYFHSSINHPVRNQIAKIFDKHNKVLSSYISNSIENLIDTTKESYTYKDSTVLSLSGCLKNFCNGREALKLKLDKVIIFFCESLEDFVNNISQDKSPSLRNKLFSSIHNLIRSIITFVQEFSDTITLTSQQIEFLKNCSEILINSNDTLMDTKINLGILLAYIAKAYEDYYEYIISASKQINNDDYQNLYKCIGLINTFSEEDFKNYPNEIIFIIIIISSTAQNNSTETKIYLPATRTLKNLSKNVLLYRNIEKGFIGNILETLLDYSLLFIEHDKDSIRYMCKDMLRNIVQCFQKFELNTMMDSYFKSCFCIKSITIKCILFSSIANVAEFLHKYPEIFKNLFIANIKDKNVNNLFEILMVKNYKECDFITWKTTWIDFLLNIYNDENNTNNIDCIENLFNKAVECDVKIVDLILISNVRLSTKFSVLWTVRRNGLITENFQNILNEIRSSFKIAFISECDNTKIMALRLLVETHKSTEFITELECENILLFLIYNSQLPNPSTRSKALRLLEKLLVKVEVNIEKSKEKQYLFKFLKELLTLLSNNLFSGASFNRKSLSLNLLKYTIEILIRKNLELSNYLPTNFTSTIFKILNDPYSSNKSLAVDILNLIKIESIIYESVTVLENLLISIRPTDSLTAAYHLEHICNILLPKEAEDFFNINCRVASIQSTYYCALIWCMKILKNGIHIANKSILLAAKINPLYGTLHAIKHLILKLNFDNIATDELWKTFFTELIGLCKISCNIVSPIVNNCSPEGHLPNDYTEYVEEELENEMKDDCSSFKNKVHLKDLKITSQMVLLCAWRTVKEICLLLGEVVLRAPLKVVSTQTHFMLEVNHVVEIGEQFKELLLETKHRGAFELAYVGFLKLCTLLWKVDHTDLNNLPMKWLQDLVNIIITDSIENNKICSTRRGAGIPFMVQALIISELEVQSSHALHFCMQKMFEICNLDNIYNFVTRTHAFNILRTLYRCKELNNIISEYITDGVIVAIRGYNCITWSEKNSATLLFSALIVRIFGVQETKDFDAINIKNKMTGRIFFLRYSRLYDFFITELKMANKLIEENKSVNNLQPILLTFCRLYDSELDGTDSNLKLNIFIPLLSKCSGSRNMHTRLLAAKALASVVPLDMISNQILHIFASSRCALLEKQMSFNYIHGSLLQVKNLLIYGQKLTSVNIEDILNHLNYIENSISGNIVIFNTILEIKINILERIPNIQNFSFCSHKLRAPLTFPDSLSFYYPVFRQCFFIYNFHILKLQSSHILLLNYLMAPLRTDVNVSIEQIDVIFSIIALITLKKSSHRNEIIEELEICGNEIKLFETLPVDYVEKLYIELITSSTIKTFLKRIMKTCKYYPKCIKKVYAISSELDKSPFSLVEILLESKMQSEDIMTTMALLSERLIFENNDNCVNTLNDIFEYLLYISQPSVPTLLRLRASRILSHLSRDFNTFMDKKFRKFGIAFACVTLCLLMDDDSAIRNNVSKIVLSINTVYQLPIISTGIVPSYAQSIFIENIANILKNNYQTKDNAYIKSFFGEIINFQFELHKKDGLNTEQEHGIFDKNEENIFSEPIKVILDCKEIFLNYFQDNI